MPAGTPAYTRRRDRASSLMRKREKKKELHVLNLVMVQKSLQANVTLESETRLNDYTTTDLLHRSEKC